MLRPHHYEGRLLVDGGLLNPVPITPTLRDLTDCTIAVDVNAPAEALDGQAATLAPASVASSDITPTEDVTFGSVADVLVGGAASASPAAETLEAAPESERPLSGVAEPDPSRVRRSRIADFINGLMEKRERTREEAGEPGLLELFARSLDVVQETVTRFKLAAQPPDLIIRIPRNVAAFYEFHRAEEIIEFGRRRTREALQHWQPPKGRKT